MPVIRFHTDANTFFGGRWVTEDWYSEVWFIPTVGSCREHGVRRQDGWLLLGPAPDRIADRGGVCACGTVADSQTRYTQIDSVQVPVRLWRGGFMGGLKSSGVYSRIPKAPKGKVRRCARGMLTGRRSGLHRREALAMRPAIREREDQ